MNAEIYLFRQVDRVYDQYIQDSNQRIFEQCLSMSTSPSQIILYREKDLVYHTYICKLGSNGYFGICVLLNGAIIQDLGLLFREFEDIIRNIADKAVLLRFDPQNGNPISRSTDFAEYRAESDRIRTRMRHIIQGMETARLSTIRYDLTSGHLRTYDFEQIKTEKRSILDDALQQNFALISSERLPKVQIRTVTKVERITVPQKSTWKTILLVAISLLSGVIIFALANSLSNRSSIKTSQTYGQQEAIQEKLNEIGKYLPILVTKVDIGNIYNDGTVETNYGEPIYSNRTMFLAPRITYQGIKTGEEITLAVKLYGPSNQLIQGRTSPTDYSYTASLSISSDSDNEQILDSWGNAQKGHYPAGAYRFEFWYGDICVAKKPFMIRQSSDDILNAVDSAVIATVDSIKAAL